MKENMDSTKNIKNECKYKQKKNLQRRRKENIKWEVNITNRLKQKSKNDNKKLT